MQVKLTRPANVIFGVVVHGPADGDVGWRWAQSKTFVSVVQQVGVSNLEKKDSKLSPNASAAAHEATARTRRDDKQSQHVVVFLIVIHLATQFVTEEKTRTDDDEPQPGPVPARPGGPVQTKQL